MADTTREEKAQDGADVAAAIRDRGMEQIEGAKGQLAEGAERVAAAVERTADDLEGDGDNAISGFGRSVASLMRQLAGGLRERDVAEFAGELAALARRNPGVFLAGSVALGFGIARVFKAQAPQPSPRRTEGWQSGGVWQSSRESARTDREFDDEERLDLSATAAPPSDKSPTDTSQVSGAAGEEQERTPPKSRQAEKRKAKSQRASSLGAPQPSSSPETSAKDPTSAGGQS